MKFKPRLTSLLSLFIAGMLPGALIAQSSLIPIETASNALVLRVEPNKDLRIAYFGKRLSRSDEYGLVASVNHQPSDPSDEFNSAYTPSGSRNLLEPAITVAHADGNYSLDLRFVSQQVTKVNDDETLLTVL